MAQAEQQYLVDQAGGSNLRATAPTRGQWFNLRTDWWIVIAMIALLAFLAGLIAFVR
jgi:hypothetical protein